jgi:hypothetical protein
MPHDDRDRSQARREAATLLGVDIDHLSAADSLRVDMVSALRLVIDHEQATVLDGREADLGKLNVAVQSLIALLPGRELPQPASSRIDPRQIMWETYIRMRRRGELAASYLSPQQRLEAARAKVAEIEAELAALAPPPDEPSPPAPPAPGGNVVKLSTRIDNPSPPASAAPAAPPPAAAPAYDYNARSEWKDYVNSDGSIRSTPRGRWDA